ncbi:uncharacterized protein NCBP2-AS2 homolog [Copidosoma floridanum]|uniref:uncharacterized protein NCBP2-AS2 homolog n=1 Tax=Copidosoma floridanum TaxID=29053 RepID=UPI0006C9B883|nr:uncharacterized protein NCBP2-AS2 homolog [Copidosoma floridanum]
MVLRFILRYLANNEQLVNKLADSKPMRRAAQMVVYLLSRTSSFSGSHQLPTNSKEFSQQIFSAAKRFSTDFQKELKSAQEEIKRKQSK